MSHFTVLVVGDYPESLLDPYSELSDLSNEEKAADERTEFCIEIEKKDVDSYIQDSILNSKYIREKPKLLKKYKDLYERKEIFEIINDYSGCIKNNRGDYGYYTNPNSKWDWYVLGGRWKDYFLLKPLKELKRLGLDTTDNELMKLKLTNLNSGKMNSKSAVRVDQALKKYIDVEKMKENCKTEAYTNYKAFEKAFRKTYSGYTIEQKISIANLKYGINNISKDKNVFKPESIIDYMNNYGHNLTTFAYLSEADGWIEKGQMGWWGMTSNEKSNNNWQFEFDNLWDNINDDELVSLYDCHV